MFNYRYILNFRRSDANAVSSPVVVQKGDEKTPTYVYLAMMCDTPDDIFNKYPFDGLRLNRTLQYIIYTSLMSCYLLQEMHFV